MQSDKRGSAKRVVILDVASECNRGDAVMQEAMVALVREFLPSAHLTAIAVYGPNQAQHFRAHFDSTGDQYDAFVPGARATHVNLDGRQTPRATRKLKNGLGLLLHLILQRVVSSRLVRALLPAAISKSQPSVNASLLQESDLVIWNGRNFRNRRGIGELYDTLAMVASVVPALLAGRRVVALGVSVWPLRFALSRRVMLAAFGRCALVTAREDATFSEIKRLDVNGNVNLVYLPDLSVLRLRPPERGERDRTRVLALTLTDWVEDGHEARTGYESAVGAAIVDLIAAGDINEVRVVQQIIPPWEDSSGSLERILNMVPPSVRERISVLGGTPSVDELVRVYSGCDALLSTRMHSSIFAASAGTPSVSIAYDHGAKWKILDAVGVGEHVVPYVGVRGDDLARRVRSVLAARDTIIADVADRLSRMREELRVGLREMLKGLE